MSLLPLVVLLLLTTTTAHGAVTNIGTASGAQEVNIFEIDIQLAAPSAAGRVFSTGQLDGFKSDVAEAFDWYLNSSLECIGGSVGLDCDYSSFYDMETTSNIQCAVTCIIPGGRSVLNVFYPVNALIDAPTRNGGREGAFAPLLLAAQNAVAARFNLDTTKMFLSEINLTAPCRSTASFSPAASASRCMGETPLSVPLPASQHRIGSTTTFVILVSSTTDAATLKTYICERAGLTPTTTNTQCLNNVLVTGTAFNSALVESLIADAIAKGAAGAITANTPTTTTVTTTTTSTSSSILGDSPFTIANYPATHSFLVTTSAISNPASIPFKVANDIRSGSILSVSPPTTDYVLLFPVSIDGGSAEGASTFTVLYDRVSEAPVIGDPIIECTFNEYTWLFALFAVIIAAYLPYTMLHRSGKKKGTKKGKALIRKQEIEEQEEMAEAAQQHMSASQVGRASMNHHSSAGIMGAASGSSGSAANPPPPLTPEQMQQMQYQYAMMQQQMAASGSGQQQMMNQQYFPQQQQQGGGGSSSVPVTPGRQPPQQQFDFTPQARF